jgi:perosamine synthetase
MTWKIPLFKIYWDDDDLKHVNKEIESGMNWAVGPQVPEFEQLIADKVNSKYAVTFNSGTSALHALLIAHDIKQGDEVIVPSFTFISTANAPLFVGAKPVFADIEEETLGLNPESVIDNITPKTKAILPVHYGGCPCKINELKEIADDHGLILIEDAAEALGAKIKNKYVGTFGDSSILSFCQNKVITTGEGGAVVTEYREIYEKLNLIRSHGRLETSDYFTSFEPFDYIQLGYNFRMSNLTAALGISQINKLHKIINMRRNNSQYLSAKLSEIDQIKILSPPKDYYHVYQLLSVIAEDRDNLMSHLAEKGIMSKVYFDPVHHSQFYKNLGYEIDLPITEKISKSVVTLPMFPTLKKEEMDYIVEEINKFYG